MAPSPRGLGMEKPAKTGGYGEFLIPAV